MMPRRVRRKNWTRQLTHASRELAPAFKASWPYTLLGLTIGILLIFLEQGLHRIEKLLLLSFGPGPLIVEHLGLGFIVSAIAVFFYEWGAHIKKALELSERLGSAVVEIGQIARAAGKNALREGLDTLLLADSLTQSEHLAQIIADVHSFVESVSALQKEGVWMKHQHTAYLSDLLAVARQNAACLRQLGREGTHSLDVPSAELIDKILAVQMKSLEEGDSYDVITNFESWRYGRLPGFSRETKDAVRSRGVQVRRIFNFRFPVYGLTQEEIEEILATQLESAQEIGERFQVRILGPDELEQSDSPELKRDAGHSHFGLFRHEDEILKISLASLNLSQIVMTTKSDMEYTVRLFEAAWSVSRPLTEDVLKNSLGNMARGLITITSG